MRNPSTTGFTLAEIIIVVAITSMLVAAWGKFQSDSFSYNRIFQASIDVNRDAEQMVRTIAKEIRSMSPASNGAYPIEAAATSSITFFNDINNDGQKERVRYFLDTPTRTLKKGVVAPTGNPVVYNIASESVTILLANVRAATSTPIFDYYPAAFTGTSSPLTMPVSLLSIRLIRATLTLDVDPNQSPVPVVVTTYAMIRNLKDNQ